MPIAQVIGNQQQISEPDWNPSRLKGTKEIEMTVSNLRKQTQFGSQSNRSMEKRHRESKARKTAIREVENMYIAQTVDNILAWKKISATKHIAVAFCLRQCESFNKYSTRIKDIVYQSVYNMLMNASSNESSYSFNRRTAGNALDHNGNVFMKDIDVDYITRQVVLQAFKEQARMEESPRELHE